MSCTPAEAVALGLLRPSRPRRQSLRQWLGLGPGEVIHSGRSNRLAAAYRKLYGVEPPRARRAGQPHLLLSADELDACLQLVDLGLFELRR